TFSPPRVMTYPVGAAPSAGAAQVRVTEVAVLVAVSPVTGFGADAISPRSAVYESWKLRSVVARQPACVDAAMTLSPLISRLAGTVKVTGLAAAVECRGAEFAYEFCVSVPSGRLARPSSVPLR